MVVSKSNRGGRKKILRFTILVVVVVLLGIEAGILMSLRGVFPGGIAPVVLSSPETENLINDPDRKWVSFDESTLAEIRSAIERDIVLSGDESLDEMATILRNWTRLKATGEGGRSLDSEDPCVILEHFENGNDFYCKPLADLYSAALASYGINSRRVGLFAEFGTMKSSHATVEVWNDEKWVVQDPTFNAHAVGVSGEMLSAREVQVVYESGERVSWIQDADDTEPKMATYFVPGEDLYSIIYYRLHGPRYENSKFVYRAQRLLDRFTGRIDSIILTRERMPVTNFVADGSVDRILLIFVIVLIIAAVYNEIKRD